MTPAVDFGKMRSRVIAWALFDFGNTAFYVVILTVGYPLYFREVIAGGAPNSDFLWGMAFSLSMACVALLSPVLGAAADAGAGKKQFLAAFTALCVAATAGLWFMEGGMVQAGIVLLILANIGFEGGLVFYDAFLPEISSARTYGRVSGYGFAAGYAGSLITLALVFPLYAGGFVPENLMNVRMSFPVAAGVFALFALPVFLVLPDAQKHRSVDLTIITAGFRRTRETLRTIGTYKNVTRFLASYFLYIDGINTIIIFSSIFTRETLRFDVGEIVLFFAMVQTSALAGAALFGVIADHLGHKRTLVITLFLWLAITCTSFFVTEKSAFFAVGIFAGIALGSSQSTSRALMSQIIPADKKTEFFGFYSFFGKASAILGPLVFGIVSTWIDQRSAILSVGLFLLAGLVLLRRVEVPPIPKN